MSKFVRGNSRAAVLTAEMVREIRHKYTNLNYSQGRLARDYQVNVNTIGRIVRWETWQEVPAEPPPEPTPADTQFMMERILKRLTDGADPTIRAEHDLKNLKERKDV